MQIRQEHNPEADLDFFCRRGLSVRAYAHEHIAKIIYIVREAICNSHCFDRQKSALTHKLRYKKIGEVE